MSTFEGYKIIFAWGISILDENDNSPKFDKASNSFILPENVPNGTNVYELYAHDPDEGINGMITYSLVTDTTDFALDSMSGQLSVAHPLDYENPESKILNTSD